MKSGQISLTFLAYVVVLVAIVSQVAHLALTTKSQSLMLQNVLSDAVRLGIFGVFVAGFSTSFRRYGFVGFLAGMLVGATQAIVTMVDAGRGPSLTRLVITSNLVLIICLVLVARAKKNVSI